MFYKHDRCGEGEEGPVCHDIYTATSADGTTFTATGTKVCSQCSVPGAVSIDGTLYLYFVDGSGTYQTLGVGISDDEGTTFEFGATTFSGATEAEQVDPDPVAYR